ncbi:hypothetical protein QYF36_021446 [Acer negundo]|nr:hypothetical protein QYF36_021446 [Acer negundo]
MDSGPLVLYVDGVLVQQTYTCGSITFIGDNIICVGSNWRKQQAFPYSFISLVRNRFGIFTRNSSSRLIENQARCAEAQHPHNLRH